MNNAIKGIDSQFFIKAIADRLNQRKTEFMDGVDWNELLKYALFHKLEGMVYLQCRSIMPREKQAVFGKHALMQFSDSNKKAAVIEKIEKKFTDEDIKFLIVKGVEVAKFYPAAKERAMGDIDVIVRSEDRERANKALLAIGFEIEKIYEDEWKYTWNGMELELHDHLLYEGYDAPKKVFLFTEDLWNYAIPEQNSSRFHLDWNYHLVFLLLHLKKHFVSSGVGLRLFVDLVVVCQKAEIDVQRLRSDLEKLDLLKFSSLCFAFCERCFGVSMPFAADIDDDFFEKYSKRFLETGIYGQMDAYFENSVDDRIIKHGRLKAFFRRYFPPVKSFLDVGPKYFYLKKHPVLLPFAWLQMYFDAIISGRFLTGKNKLTRFFAADTALEERKKLFSDWDI